MTHQYPTVFYPTLTAILLLLNIQCCICQVQQHNNMAYISLNREDDLKMLISCQTHSETRLPSDELPELSNVHPVERTLRGLAYIPLSEQKLHSNFKTGFNSLLRMMENPLQPIPSSMSYSALPNLKLSDEPGQEKYMVVDVNISAELALITWLNSTCEFLVSDKYKKTFRFGFKCRVGYDRTKYISNSSVLDALGFWGMQIFNQSWQDVFMKIPNWAHTFVSPNAVWYADGTSILNYNVEKRHPRSTWPAWVNLYLFLRKSYHDCSDIMDSIKCVNIFTNIHQLSLTYAYFVCRITNGEAGDALCPKVCDADPCSKIENAVEGTCYPIGLRIHWYDYFCFCAPGYVWVAQKSRDVGGRCVKSALESNNVDECTPFEKSTFCSEVGTISCVVVRNSTDHNRMPVCNCWPTYAGINCGYQIQDSCHNASFRGRLHCRENENNNGTSNGKCNPEPSGCDY